MDPRPPRYTVRPGAGEDLLQVPQSVAGGMIIVADPDRAGYGPFVPYLKFLSRIRKFITACTCKKSVSKVPVVHFLLIQIMDYQFLNEFVELEVEKAMRHRKFNNDEIGWYLS